MSILLWRGPIHVFGEWRFKDIAANLFPKFILSDVFGPMQSAATEIICLPLVTVPPRLVEIAAYLARYKLYGTNTTEQVRNNYTDSIKFLKQLVIGNVSLGLDVAGDVVKIASVATVISSRSVFGRSGNRGY